MKMIRHIGSLMLVFFCILGMLIVLGVVGSATAMHLTKTNNIIVKWFVQNVSVDTNFLSGLAKKYPEYNNQIGKYKYYIYNTKILIENICTTSFPDNDRITYIANTYGNKVLNIDRHEIKRYNEESPPEVIRAKNDIMDLYDYCLNQKMFFAYVQVPSELRYDLLYNKQNVVKDTLKIEDINNADMLVSCLVREGIPVLDLSRNERLMSDLVFVNSHWSCENALYATKLLEDYLHKWGLIKNEINMNNRKYFNVLSSHIFRKLRYEYTLPVPIKSDFYSVTLNENDSNQGVFSDVFLKNEATWGNDQNENAAYYNLWRLENGDLMTIRNDSKKFKETNEKKVLLLGDSFSWPVSAYLSQEIEKIDTFHPQYFPGSTKKYIKLTQPDIILLMYFDGQINSAVVGNAYDSLTK